MEKDLKTASVRSRRQVLVLWNSREDSDLVGLPLDSGTAVSSLLGSNGTVQPRGEAFCKQEKAETLPGAQG